MTEVVIQKIEDKTNENYEFVKDALSNNADNYYWHCIAGRIYFSIYQKIKSLLIPVYSKVKDYKVMQKYYGTDQIIRGKKVNSFSIPHGQKAVAILAEAIGNNILDVENAKLKDLSNTVRYIGSLYNLRLKSDYDVKHNVISKREVQKNKEYADKILEELNSIISLN